METTGQNTSKSIASSGESGRQLWLNPRRKRFWVVAAVALYTLLGFLVVPLIVKNRVISLLQEDLGRTATIEKVAFHPYELSLRVQGFEMGDSDGVRHVAFDDFFVNLQLSSVFQQAWMFREIRLVRPYFLFERFEDGDTRLGRLMADLAALEPATANEPQSQEPDESPLKMVIDELTLSDGGLDLTDQGVNPAGEAGIRGFQLTATEVSSREAGSFPFKLSGNFEAGGQFELEGKLALAPELSLSGDLRTRAVPLTMAEPYAGQFARILIEAGTLDSELEFSLPAGKQFSAGGSLQIPGLEIKDAVEEQRLLGWRTMDIDRFDLDLDAGSLHFSRLLFEQPYARIVIFEDLSTNLSGLRMEEEAPAEATDGEPMNVVIGGIRVDNGSMDFSDLSLPLPFATRIAEMDGAISTIATDSSEPASINLEGKVDEYGLARIDGSMNLLDPVALTDIKLEFRNLLMSSLSPYSVAFAGREIDEGKLDLDLRYVIDSGQLQGENDLVISDLVLGDKVDHPDAASLPLGLAVALLKDSKGVIDIELPVQGDINDPEFRIGGVVLKALVGLVTKVVTAPFALLGRLIGVESEDMGEFQFLAGRADLTPPELEKIAQLERALQERPELVVEISGVFDPAIDVPALQSVRLDETLRDMLDDKGGEQDNETLMLDVEIRQVLELLFSQRYPGFPLESVKLAHTAAPAEDPEGKPVLDGPSYSGDLRTRLLATEIISEQDLAKLAQARAEAIKTAFLAGSQITEGRVVISGSKETGSEDGEWVALELAVAPK
jgi:hypothetical protein